MRQEIIEKMSALITSAFGLVAALAWNSAIQAIFSKYYQKPGEDILGQVIYASVVTVVAVLITVWISLAAKRAEEREEALKTKIKEIDKKIRDIHGMVTKRK